MVDKSEMEEHNEEKHKLVECKDCKIKVETQFFEEHNKNCPKKPKMCEFCKCLVKAEEYSTHNYACGSRTKKCDVCGKNIVLREHELHQDLCLIQQQEAAFAGESPNLYSEPNTNSNASSNYSYIPDTSSQFSSNANSRYAPETVLKPQAPTYQTRSNNIKEESYVPKSTKEPTRYEQKNYEPTGYPTRSNTNNDSNSYGLRSNTNNEPTSYSTKNSSKEPSSYGLRSNANNDPYVSKPDSRGLRSNANVDPHVSKTDSRNPYPTRSNTNEYSGSDKYNQYKNAAPVDPIAEKYSYSKPIYDKKSSLPESRGQQPTNGNPLPSKGPLVTDYSYNNSSNVSKNVQPTGQTRIQQYSAGLLNDNLNKAKMQNPDKYSMKMDEEKSNYNKKHSGPPAPTQTEISDYYKLSQDSNKPAERKRLIKTKDLEEPVVDKYSGASNDSYKQKYPSGRDSKTYETKQYSHNSAVTNLAKPNSYVPTTYSKKTTVQDQPKENNRMEIEYDDEVMAKNLQYDLYNDQGNAPSRSKPSGPTRVAPTQGHVPSKRTTKAPSSHSNPSNNNDLNINRHAYGSPGVNHDDMMYEDPEYQRVIQESLKEARGNPMGETWNDDSFKKAMELSKQIK
jgi:hypothetical protein